MKFSLIEADPPWHFKTYSSKGDRIQQNHYKVMTLDDIKGLPVKEVTTDDCALLLWGTWPLLPQCLEVGQAWGFTYKTCAFDWVKSTINGHWHFGNGYWTRANSEPCLLFTKGKPNRINKGVSQIISASRPHDFQYENALIAQVKKHSQKPDEFYKKVELLFGDVPKLRLFARSTRPQWVSLGNEITGNDIKKDLEMLADDILVRGD